MSHHLAAQQPAAVLQKRGWAPGTGLTVAETIMDQLVLGHVADPEGHIVGVLSYLS
jgi:hypothetical protein